MSGSGRKLCWWLYLFFWLSTANTVISLPTGEEIGHKKVAVPLLRAKDCVVVAIRSRRRRRPANLTLRKVIGQDASNVCDHDPVTVAVEYRGDDDQRVLVRQIRSQKCKEVKLAVQEKYLGQ